MISRPRFDLLLLVGCAALCAGCSCSRFPSAPDSPDVSAGRAGREAINQYDGNGDDALDAEEVKQSPALAIAFERIDSDRDGKLTDDEISARIKSWLKSGTTLMAGTTLVTLDGQVLEGATVTFEPEEFLGPAYQPCSGVSDQSGQAAIEGPLEDYPGIYLGFYRIRVSKQVSGRETIPARYNSQTELGYEVADDLPDIHSLIEFHLKSR